MTGFLVPIRAYALPDLAVVQFAVEFGKRNGGRFFFLFVDDPSDSQNRPDHPAFQEETVAMITRAVVDEGLKADIEYRRGDFIQAIHQFISDHHPAEIIMAVPDEAHPRFEAISRDIQLLLQMTHCRILTVKAKSQGE